jgi:hypothetical protein
LAALGRLTLVNGAVQALTDLALAAHSISPGRLLPKCLQKRQIWFLNMMLAGAPNRKRRRVGAASASLQQYAADLFETQLDLPTMLSRTR